MTIRDIAEGFRVYRMTRESVVSTACRPFVVVQEVVHPREDGSFGSLHWELIESFSSPEGALAFLGHMVRFFTRQGVTVDLSAWRTEAEQTLLRNSIAYARGKRAAADARREARRLAEMTAGAV